MPTPPFYLFGQHFTAIAAAGPIVGPIVACLQFGWLPCLLWIVLGVVFIGAVHDFSALVASVRHEARSIAEIVKENLGPRAWVALMLLHLARAGLRHRRVHRRHGEHVRRPHRGARRRAGRRSTPAARSPSPASLYLLLAIVMGLVAALRQAAALARSRRSSCPRPSAWSGSARRSRRARAAAAVGAEDWGAILLVYCFVASLLPVWLLLQPRGYLGGFVLYLVLAVGVIGIFFGGFAVAQPAFKGFEVGGLTGVAVPVPLRHHRVRRVLRLPRPGVRGTTSKQIARETHCQPVGYGAMLCEAFVALIALVTVMIASPTVRAPRRAPSTARASGGSSPSLLGREHLLFATIFGAMAFSTFVFDTLDVATRLGRYILQELFDWRSRASGALATLATVGRAAALPAERRPAAPGKPPTYMAFWTLFGTSNQLLAALTLLAITVWLKRRDGRAGSPGRRCCFVLVVTVWALVLQARSGFTASTRAAALPFVNGCVAVALLGLASLVVLEALRAVQDRERRVAPVTRLTPPCRIRFCG